MSTTPEMKVRKILDTTLIKQASKYPGLHG
jgi:hypothetical protein